MKRLELGIGQIGNMFGIATRIEPIGRIGEQRSLRPSFEQVVGRGIIALHLIVDDALVGERRIERFQFVMPALLLHDGLADARIEHCVEIDVDEIVEIPKVLAGDRIDRLVGEGHRVEERVERALHQLNERILDRVFARAAQHGMFENMSDAGGIRRRCAKGDAKHFVFIVVDKREQFGARLGVPIQPAGRIDLGEGLLAQQFKTKRVSHPTFLKQLVSAGDNGVSFIARPPRQAIPKSPRARPDS